MIGGLGCLTDGIGNGLSGPAIDSSERGSVRCHLILFIGDTFAKEEAQWEVMF